MEPEVTYISADTEAGKRAINEVMEHSFREVLIDALAPWSFARIVNGVPVSFVIIDPFHEIEVGTGTLRYAFICDIATREDRRGEGHFRALMAYSFDRIRSSGIPLVILHGHADLYRKRSGFETFTYHQGVFTSHSRISDYLGSTAEITTNPTQFKLLTRGVQDDLLVITDVEVENRKDCIDVLRQSAALAQQQAKERILIEYPFNSSRERSYPFCMSAGSVFTDLAETIGANVVRTAAYPEEGPVYHGDWISVLDPSTLLSQATALADTPKGLPEAQVNIVAQEVCMAIQSDGRALKVSNLRLPNTETIELKSTELARLVTGFHTIDDYIATNARREISGSVLELLRALYPKTWRYSRNENWTYKS